MAHSKQAEKRHRQNLKARTRNRVQRSTMKTAVKRVVTAPSTDAAKTSMPLAVQKIDKAAKHGVIHKNAAARMKSRLAKRAVGAR